MVRTDKCITNRGEKEIRFGVDLPHYPFEETFETAFLAKKLGYDSVWMPDHIVITDHATLKPLGSIDSWIALGVIATKVKGLSLGIGVTDPQRFHPALLAQRIATLDIISKGRFIFGIGMGEALNLDVFGIKKEKSVKKLREAITVIRMLLTQETVNFDGSYYKLSNASIGLNTTRENIPLWVAANSPLTLKVAAEMADGWLPVRLSPELYAEDLRKIQNHAKAIGRDPNSITPSYLFWTVVSKNNELARKNIASLKSTFLYFPRTLQRLGYAAFSDESLNGFNFTPTSVSEKCGMFLKKAKDLPMEVIEKCWPFGTPENCINLLEKFIKAGLRYVIIQPYGSKQLRKETLRLFACEVIPYFRK